MSEAPATCPTCGSPLKPTSGSLLMACPRCGRCVKVAFIEPSSRPQRRKAPQ